MDCVQIHSVIYKFTPLITQRKGWSTLLEKKSKFPRYNMKCRGKPDTT